MVIRNKKHNRKYFGTRRWGAGNIKNRRGAGDRGGVGNAGARKHNFTSMTAKSPWLIRRKGFTKWNPKTLLEANLRQISSMKEDGSGYIVLKGYKVLSNGSLERPAKIKATKFSKKAVEKIERAGGQALPAEGQN
jgi:large subunit ribosomal protein L15